MLDFFLDFIQRFGSVLFYVFEDIHWLDDEDKKTYFELRMIYNELTEDLMLEITDWAEPDEIEDQKDLWDSDIEKMRRVSGL